MEAQQFEKARTWVIRIDPGEDVLESINKFLEKNGVSQGYVAAGYGTLTRASLHWVRHNRLPTDNLFADVEGGIEILAANGLVTEGEPHVHIALSTPTGAFGGHLEPGSKAYVLCEFVVVELEGPTMRKPRVEISRDAEGKPVTVQRLTFGE